MTSPGDLFTGSFVKSQGGSDEEIGLMLYRAKVDVKVRFSKLG